MAALIRFVLAFSTSVSLAETADCNVIDTVRCDNTSDDTAALQALLRTCADAGRRIVFKAGRTCLTQPLNLSSHTAIFFEDGAKLRAGSSDVWNNNTPGVTMITAQSVRNLTITGKGTIDGAGEQWYNGPGKDFKPVLVQFLNTTDVVLEDFTLLNAARQHIGLYGARFVVRNIEVRSPNEISTDGIDVGAIGVHVTNVDITNGDDSIIMKADAQDVLIENSVVRQGHGIGFGTTGKPNMTNITFRNILVNGTMDGIHIKFKDNQHGSVANVLFENISIVNVSRYGLMIDTQVRNSKSRESRIKTANITFRNITASAHQAGYFSCNGGQYNCNNIVLENVLLDAKSGCSFNNTFGHGSGVSPRSCFPPRNLDGLQVIV